MTSCVQAVDSKRSGYYLLDPEEDEFAEPFPPSTARAVPPSSSTSRHAALDRWHAPDPLAELIDELKLTGRPHEAEVIERVLGLDDDEEAMRAYVFRQWSDDWDSPEDAVYDDR